MPEYLKAGLTSLAIVLIGGPLLIPFLSKLKFGQHVRTDGPQAHLSKAGTPTMGGVLFTPALLGAFYFSGSQAWQGSLAMLLILALGLVGFADDFLKIRKEQSEGLTAKEKMIGQLTAALIFSLLLYRFQGGELWIPFWNQFLDIGIWRIPLSVLVVVAAANGVNLTDGLDGLATGVTMIVTGGMLVLTLAWSIPELSWMAAAVTGACMGFLYFNMHPAKVFMGDTGSLTLGGAVAALALISQTELLLPLIGIIYVLEVLSDIVQVAYFKRTGGKRLLRMAPLHHHFELGGWSESRVTLTFWSITLVATALYLLLLL